MHVLKRMTALNDSLLFRPDFRRVIEQHLTWIRKHPSTTSELVDVEQAYRFRGDLFGYLKIRGVNSDMAWVIMRVNEWNHPIEFDESVREILIPDESIIITIRNGYLTTQKKLN